VTASGLYWDSTTSNLAVGETRMSSVINSGVSFSAALTTAQLQGTLPSGFVTPTEWNTSAGLYPYLKVFYPTQPRAIQGVAYLSNGSVAQRAQVAQYTSGTLLNGGTASTGVNGYYYSLVGANTLFTDSAIPESIATITVNSGGSSWNNNGTVTISGGGGSGATATTTRYNTTNVATSSIQNITLGNAGSGYTSLPNVTVSNGSNTGTGATFNVTLNVPGFNTTQLATLLMMDGVTAINTTVAGMSYTDRILLNDTTAYLYKDGNTNVIGQVRQGITRLSTQNASASLMNTDINTTVGTTKRSSFASNLTTISSLELYARASAFDLNTNLTYADNGVSNAGNITVNGNSSVTLSGGSFVSTKAQTYNALLTLAADTNMNATDVTTNATLAGANYKLSI